MDSTDRLIGGIVLLLMLALVGSIHACDARTNSHIQRMTEKGLCNTRVDRTNETPVWEWRKCQ